MFGEKGKNEKTPPTNTLSLSSTIGAELHAPLDKTQWLKCSNVYGEERCLCDFVIDFVTRIYLSVSIEGLGPSNIYCLGATAGSARTWYGSL